MSTDEPPDEPAHLLCPITRAMFRDPVFVPCSGNTYEREALEKFWSSAPGRARDPLTNVETRANSRVVYTNWDKRREVRDYLDARSEDYVPSGWTSRAVPAPRSDGDGDARERGRGLANGAVKASAVLTVLAIAALVSASGAEGGTWGFGAVGARRGTPRMPNVDEYGRAVELRAPAGSRVRARKVSSGTPALEITVPAQSVNTAALLFSVPWFAITGTWTYGAWNAANPLFASFSLPFWAVGLNMVHQSATSAFETTKLLLTTDQFYLEKTIFDRRMFYLKGDVADLSKAAVETYAYVNGAPQSNLVLHHGVKSYVLARGLHSSEDEFVADEIEKFLKKYRRARKGGDAVKIDTTTPFFARARM